MKRIILLCSVCFSALALQAAPVGSTFTYQGTLSDGGAPATGLYDFWFTLVTDAAGGTAIGNPLPRFAVPVSNGLFVVQLNFGSSPFDGEARWLDIAVRTNNAESFSTLGPRQLLRPTPYAISARSVSGPLSASQLSGVGTNAVTLNNPGNVLSGDGSGLTGVNAATLQGMNSTNFWQVGGNANTTPGTDYIGTSDNKALELKANGQRVMRIEPALAPNIIGGASANIVSNGVFGATIAGGGLPSQPNRVGGYYGVIGGGHNNVITRDYAFIGGGQGNIAGYGSVVGGGAANKATNTYSVVPGGSANTAGGVNSFAAGGAAQAAHDGTFVWSDGTSSFASTTSNQFSIRATGGVRLDNTTSMQFGTGMRQMLNLWNTNYGIGIQSSSLYFRCNNQGADDGFIWYRGGGHSDAYANAGGGVELMHLVNAGLYVKGALISSSDRNSKQGLKDISPVEVLDKVVSMPISEWSYKHDPDTRHVGPMAQDFRAAFGLGTDDKHIATVDADGVAFAAIQGLNQKLQEKDSEIQELKKAVAELKAEIKGITNGNR